jgi:hypothetical protein
VIVQAAPWMHYAWLIERAGVSATGAFKAIEAVGDDGRIHGMMGYDSWTANSVIMSIALENPACFRTLLRSGFEYPFVQADRGVALCTIRATNTRSMKLTEHTGFKLAYRIRDGITVGEDLLLYEMRRENCRWIPQEYRKAA